MGRKKTPCWIGLCIPSVFVILPRTKNPLSWVTLPLPPLLLKGMLFRGVLQMTHYLCGSLEWAISSLISGASSALSPTDLWRAPALQPNKLLAVKTLPIFQGPVQKYLHLWHCYSVPPTRMPSLWSSQSLFKLLQQQQRLRPGTRLGVKRPGVGLDSSSYQEWSWAKAVSSSVKWG